MAQRKSRRETESIMQLSCRLQCMVSGPGGCVRESSRKRQRHRNIVRNKTEPRTIDGREGIHPQPSQHEPFFTTRSANPHGLEE